MVFPSIPGPVMTLVITAIPYLIAYYASIQQTEDYVANVLPINSPDDQVYDFIVVGGGSAGAVVANRISASPMNYKVLLLEAGGDPSWVSYIPMTDLFASHQPSIDWMYQTVPQRNACLSMNDQRNFAARGKCLGGTSSINFMIYIRGNQANFDEWGNITGDASWNAQGVLPFFMKSERYQGNYPNSGIHGTEGPLYVDKSTYHPSRDIFFEAINELGYPEQDVNLNQTDAWMKIDTTTVNGVRWSTYSAFIEPALTRRNLVVSRYSKVTKIIFDPNNSKKVIGVQYFRQNNSIPKYAFASKEVISSAGAFNSPQLLLLSGIGPSEDLIPLKIPVVLNNNNVGKNLQDHLTTYLFMIFNETRTSFILERDFIPDTLTLYDSDRSGPAGSANLFATGYTSSSMNADPTWPDIQLFAGYTGISGSVADGMNIMYNYRKGTIDEYLKPYSDMQTDGNLMAITQVRPRSVGTVKLASKDPNVAPLIDPNYFSDPENFDLQGMIEGMKYAVNLYENTTAYKRYNATLLPKLYPGCENHVFKSDAYYECYVRQFTGTIWHFAGTCRMGKANDPKAVVDPQLRVIGVDGLRVVDNSIMPIVTNGNTNAPAIMIGEKGADMILKTWENVTSSTPAISPLVLSLIKTVNNILG